MRKSPHPFKKFLTVFGSVILVILILLLVALQWPGVWLRPATLNWAQEKFNQHFPDMNMHWTESQVQTETLGIFSDRILFSFRNFCFRRQPQTEACFDTLQAGLAYSLLKLQLTEVGPLRANGGQIVFEKAPSQGESAPSQTMPQLPRWLENAVVKPVFINVPTYEIRLGERKFQGSLQVTSNLKSRVSGLEQSLEAHINDEEWGQIQAVATTLSEKVKGPWRLNSEADLNLPKQSKLHAVATLEPRMKKNYDYQISARFSSTGPRLALALSGHYQPGLIAGIANGQVKSGPQFFIENCQYRVSTHDQKTQLTSDCPVRFPLSQLKQKKARALTRHLRHPNVGVRILSDVRTTYPPSANDPVSGHLQVKPFSSFPQILETNGGLAADFEFTPAELPHLTSLSGDVDFSSEIHRFQKVVQFLQNTPLAVPAPLRTLRGRIEMNAQGPFNAEGGQIRSSIRTNLKSRYQTLVTETHIFVTAILRKFKPQKISLISDVNLKDVQLTLPPTEGLPPTQYLPDGRILLKPLAAAKPAFGKPHKATLPLAYNVRIHTPKDSALRLQSNSTDEPVTVGMDFHLRDHQPIKGSLDLAPIQYDVAGIQGTTGGLSLSLRATSYQTYASGSVTSGEGDENSRVIIAQDPMDTLARPQPKLPVPLLELATATGLRDPLSLALVDQRQPNPPKSNSQFGTIPLQIRRRY